MVAYLPLKTGRSTELLNILPSPHSPTVQADFVVWDPKGTRELLLRNTGNTDFSNVTQRNWSLFGIMSIGSKEALRATYIMGKLKYANTPKGPVWY